MPEIKSRANHPASASPSRRTQSRRRNGIPPEQLHGPVKRNSVELYRSRKIVQTYPKTMRCRRVYRPRLPRHLCNRMARIPHFYRFDCPSPRIQKTDVTEQRYVKYRPELFNQIKDKMDVYGINNGTNMKDEVWHQKMQKRKPSSFLRNSRVFRGADGRIRTGDLILTKDALYRLSYISIGNE